MSENSYARGQNGRPAPRGATLAAQVSAAERLASSLVSGFGLCADTGAPLSERQQACLITAALLEFDGIEAEVKAVLALEELLERLRPAA